MKTNYDNKMMLSESDKVRRNDLIKRKITLEFCIGNVERMRNRNIDELKLVEARIRKIDNG